MSDLDALLEPWRREHQTGYQLGRRGSIKSDVAAADLAAAAHHERHSAAAAVIDFYTGLPQPGQQFADWSLRGPRVTTEPNVTSRQRRGRWYEPQHRAGVADIDSDRA